MTFKGHFKGTNVKIAHSAQTVDRGLLVATDKNVPSPRLATFTVDLPEVKAKPINITPEVSPQPQLMLCILFVRP